MSALVPCPDCRGEGGSNVLGHRAGACTTLWLPCQACNGAKLVTPEREAALLQAKLQGTLMRQSRVLRGLSLGEEARRLKCSVVELAARERGIVP